MEEAAESGDEVSRPGARRGGQSREGVLDVHGREPGRDVRPGGLLFVFCGGLGRGRGLEMLMGFEVPLVLLAVYVATLVSVSSISVDVGNESKRGFLSPRPAFLASPPPVFESFFPGKTLPSSSGSSLSNLLEFLDKSTFRKPDCNKPFLNVTFGPFGTNQSGLFSSPSRAIGRSFEPSSRPNTAPMLASGDASSPFLRRLFVVLSSAG